MLSAWFALLLGHAASSTVGSSVRSSTSTAADPLPATQEPEDDLASSGEGDDWHVAGMPVRLHGFVSQGFLLSTHNNYLGQSRRGTPEFSDVAINLTVPVTERLRAGVQLFARDLGPVGNYTPRLDWYYADYRFRDWLGFRFGRVNLPFGLYNETSDADLTRTAILLPQSVYPIEGRDVISAQTGGELYGYQSIGPLGSIDYRLWGGTIYIDVPYPQTGSFEILGIDSPYIFGGRLLWETPLERLRLGVSLQRLRLTSSFRMDAASIASSVKAGLIEDGFDGLIDFRLGYEMWLLSAEYGLGDLNVAAEYGRWTADPSADPPNLLAVQRSTSERAYVGASYRLADWLVVGSYYSILIPDVAESEGASSFQRDVSLTLRFDLERYWLLKLEGHAMHGTAALRAALNDDSNLDHLEPTWVFFLAKTTLFF